MDRFAWYSGGETFRIDEALWQDSERIFYKGVRVGRSGQSTPILAATALDNDRSSDCFNRFMNEYRLREQLDGDWALRPIELIRDADRTLLVLNYVDGQPAEQLAASPMEIGPFLGCALSLAGAVRQLHARSLVHKDITPGNTIVNLQSRRVWLTGFGIASHIPRERQAPEPPEFIAGTLAYMAPEQTGRMNRLIDSRSDLYALGATLYHLVTGTPPFSASDPMELIHSHIARRPQPPIERLSTVPAQLSAIIMKLLAKTAEDRYQTAAGVEGDLERCLEQWNAHHRIEEFALGARDVPDRLLVPEKLYGRAAEVKTLLSAFERVVATGKPELVLVSGFSGVGKSSLVNELHKVLVPPRGLFAAGKFNQYKRDIPYATLAQAFQTLIRLVLSKNEDELARWRHALSEALAPNGLLIADLVPELKHIIGDQPPVPELPLQAAQGRFRMVVRQFIGVFARPEHPLALFLDDLQWLDVATLDLLNDLLTRDDVENLFLVGAYRDNEVSESHPLVRTLESIRAHGGAVQEIALAPLTRGDIRELVSDTFHCDTHSVGELATLIHEKTGGNPYFSLQFLSELADAGLIAFDHRRGAWSWDLEKIRARNFTDNVVDLMIAKLSRLPADTQRALELLACMGISAELEWLTLVYEGSVERLHKDLWEAVRAGLIYRSTKAYTFSHDRVQEAAYSMIPEDQRAVLHLKIGTLLADHVPEDRREELVFEIVNQLNRGAHLITSERERERVAELDLLAAQQAKSSAAYASALNCLAAGRALLSESHWTSNYRLLFAIEFLMAECELLTADMIGAEHRLAALAARAANPHDVAAVARLRLTLYTTQDRSDRGVEVFLDYFNGLGEQWSAHPSAAEVQREYDQIWATIGERRIEDLIELPLNSDAALLDILDTLTEVVTPALFVDPNLSSLVICRMVNLCLVHGNCDAACFAYVWFAIIAGPRFENYHDGYRFGELGYQLVEQKGLKRYQARTYMSFGNIVMPWRRHVLSGRELVRRAFETAYRAGDLTFAAYSRNELVSNYLAVGDPLGEAQAEAARGLAFAKSAGFGLVVGFISAQEALIRTLRGLNAEFGVLDHADFKEAEFEARVTANPVLLIGEFHYLTCKIQARVFSAQFASAAAAAMKARNMVWTSPSQLETAEFNFYGAIAHAGCIGDLQAEERAEHIRALHRHYAQLEVWARNCPENFENRLALVGAEIARIEGRLPDAERLYEEAIRSARANGFVQNQALANECAGRFYTMRGLDEIAQPYLRDARHCYARWGADGKVRQMDRLYPKVKAELVFGAEGVMAPGDLLDLSTVMKVSQAISAEIVEDKLVDALLRTAIEYAGAERVLLILGEGQEYRIEAEASVSGQSVAVQVRRAKATAADLPVSILNYVAHTCERVLLDDASVSNAFSSDAYVMRNHLRSVLCVPLVKQGSLVGVLYFENNLTPNAFTPDRIVVLTFLASQAAMSLENTRLYADLRDREAKVRRLMLSNLDAVVGMDAQGRITEWNPRAEGMFGWSREEAIGRPLAELIIPHRYRAGQRAGMARFLRTGEGPYLNRLVELPALRRDGREFPVEFSVVSYQVDGIWEFSGFIRDISERKRSEQAMLDSERRFRAVQSELAHASRVATMGQLSASIGHEVNQPISAAITNAHVGLHWLDSEPADIGKVRLALERIALNAKRAAMVIDRIRMFMRKEPPAFNDVQLNDAILEVIDLTRGEALKTGVKVETRLGENLPAAKGDRVQLQQVMLNLIINAIEAMGESGPGPRELLVTSAVNADHGLLVTVADTGPGFAEAGAERVFEAFYTTKEKGLGMGLSISRSIIEAHGGRLWKSRGVTRGATLCFSLPLEPDEGSADAAGS